MNTKAQQGPLEFLAGVVVFVILWFTWIGGWLVDVGQQGIIDGSLTGFEAFVYANLNVFVFIGLTLSILGYMYFISGQ